MQIPKHKSKGKRIAAVVTLLVTVLLVLGGYLAWQEFVKLNKQGELTVTETGSQSIAASPVCAKGQDESASEGRFCSKDIGIKMMIPKLFTGKLQETSNYPVYQGPLNPNSKMSAGTSLHVFEATVTSGGTFTFTIAQEPMRTGYVDVYNASQNSYFDATTKQLTSVTSTGGKFVKGEPLPSFTAGMTQFFQGTSGDAGANGYTYLTVVNDKLVTVSLEYKTGKTATGTSPSMVKDVLKDLENSLKTFETI